MVRCADRSSRVHPRSLAVLRSASARRVNFACATRGIRTAPSTPAIFLALCARWLRPVKPYAAVDAAVNLRQHPSID